MPVQRLSEQEISSAARDLPQWTVENGKLHRTFQFPSFANAIGFMMTAAVEIDKRDHHPEWHNVYNRVTVDLSTHDAGGITVKDVELAKLLNQIAARLA